MKITTTTMTTKSKMIDIGLRRKIVDLWVRNVVAEITMDKDVAPLKILVMKVRVTVMDPGMEVHMMAMLDVKEILYVEGTIVKNLDHTSI